MVSLVPKSIPDDLSVRLRLALAAREHTAAAQAAERVAVARFIHEARLLDWPWSRIGSALGISDNAVRNYYTRNNRKVTQ
jgi:hypothetical protein